MYDREMTKLLILEPYIAIEYDVLNNWIYANWTGDQTKDTVMAGCEKILQCLVKEQCSKVLNDNTHVTSTWADASEWVARDWFPRMSREGLRFFAWVYSPNAFSRLSTDQTLNYNIPDVIAIPFSDIETAMAWLKAV